MVFVMRRWRTRTLEGGHAVETSLIPDRIALELEPVMQTAPLTPEGRAAILADDYRQPQRLHQAWSVRTRRSNGGSDPCAIVIRPYYMEKGIVLSTARNRQLELSADGELFTFEDGPPVVSKFMYRTMVLTPHSVATLYSSNVQLAWLHLGQLLVAKHRTPMNDEDLAFLAGVGI